MPEAYEEMVNKIPAETRWAICAQALTGAVMGLDALVQELVGPEKRREAVGKFFTAGAPAFKQLIEALGLPTHDLPAMANSVLAAAVVVYGPEAQVQTVEASPKKVVTRNTGCPFPARFKETGITMDCLPVCTAYWEAIFKALNPNAVFQGGDKCLGRGDAYCGDRVLELP